MKRQNVRTLSLIVCTFTYLLIGAAVFDALESDNELDSKRTLLQEQHDIKTLYNITDEDFDDIRWLLLRSKPYHNTDKQWKFTGALYFTLVVVSLIGKCLLLSLSLVDIACYHLPHWLLFAIVFLIGSCLICV